MTRIITILLLSIMIAGCNPLKHYQKVATDTNVTPKKKKILAPWVSANFPTEERFAPGDTLVRVDTLTKEDTIYWETVDTLRIQEPVRTVTKYVTRTITIRDTIYRSDEAKIFYMKDQLAKAEYTITQQAAEIDDLKIQIGLSEDQVRKLWFWLIGILVAAGVFVFLSIKKKIPFL